MPLLTLVFAVGGGTIGIAEETLVFLPALLLLSRSLGYDSLIAGGIALVGANAGFAAAFMNPFTVGVAQGIVGLPLFSGMGFRLVLWAVMTTVTVVFLTRYARRVKANPGISLMRDFDRESEGLPREDGAGPFTRRHALVLLLVAAALVVLVFGAIRWDWGLLQLSGLFFGLALVSGPIGGLSLDDTAQSFIQGASDMTYAGLVVGLARGTLVILRDANVIDTLTHALAAASGACRPRSASSASISCRTCSTSSSRPGAARPRYRCPSWRPSATWSASPARPTSWPTSWGTG